MQDALSPRGAAIEITQHHVEFRGGLRSAFLYSRTIVTSAWLALARINYLWARKARNKTTKKRSAIMPVSRLISTSPFATFSLIVIAIATSPVTYASLAIAFPLPSSGRADLRRVELSNEATDPVVNAGRWPIR